MTKHDTEKICFVISPIGDEGSDTRRRADQVLKHIISPAAKDCGYETPIRADQISEPGIITSQVIQHLVEDALVIADLTGRNPNVFYELAIRHAVRKPCVQIIHVNEAIPFDVAASRTIHVDHHDLDSVAKCRDELAQQIRSVEKDASQVDTPISVALDLQSLRRSDNPLEKSNAEIISMLQEIRAAIGEPRRYRIHPGMMEEMLMHFDRAMELLDCPEGEEPVRERLEEARHALYRWVRVFEQFAMESGMHPAMIEELMERRRRKRVK